MDIRVAGKHIEIGETLQEQVRTRLAAAVEKYFDRSAEAHVTFSKERNDFRADCSVHLASGVTLQAKGTATDAYHAFDTALEHLEKRVRRYMRRLKNHHDHGAAHARVDSNSPFE
jgi:ribosomal subunit interface protein